MIPGKGPIEWNGYRGRFHNYCAICYVLLNTYQPCYDPNHNLNVFNNRLQIDVDQFELKFKTYNLFVTEVLTNNIVWVINTLQAWNILGKLGQYHSCWCPGSCCHQGHQQPWYWLCMMNKFNSLWPSDAILWKKIWVNISSGNGLLPDSTKPLPEPILNYHH